VESGAPKLRLKLYRFEVMQLGLFLAIYQVANGLWLLPIVQQRSHDCTVERSANRLKSALYLSHGTRNVNKQYGAQVGSSQAGPTTK
jgi:lipopolysaccharide export LptBFGC system permease protein LptF